ncbi:hypothetical protein CGGC5_v011804 [Colletotrichum fructicola Nara gc5]|uniref:Uncharacterized protein n=1 Tax=Colletotrichum fructicola (strain Nara gc5) TaxID=1213859 RepID=A0A7J6IRL1_COLFN|nr:hypothetical protein CGGC5_v011804 [Colletotrichum fructicola Nara gc5]
MASLDNIMEPIIIILFTRNTSKDFTMAPRIPTAKSTETLCYGVATTTKWAPRWERNISYFTPAAERGIKRVEPPVSRIVKRIDDRLPLEKMAKGIDKRIKNGIERFNNTK